MIKRRYFYNIRWNWCDGKQGYSVESGTLTQVSWRDEGDEVYKWITSEVKNNLKHKSAGGFLEVMSFNRI